MKIFNFVFAFSVVFLLKISTNGQTPIIEWQRSIGGSAHDGFGHTIPTIDNGYISFGQTFSNNGDIYGNHGSSDVLIVKFDNDGILQWQKCFGGSNQEAGGNIIQTSDGGYIFVTGTESTNGDVTENHGNFDVWVVKLDVNGVIQWKKCYGGTSIDYGSSISQTSDGGYIIAGRTLSNNGDVNGNHGDYDVWILKISNLGNIQWKKCYGGSAKEEAISIISTNDNGYLLIAQSESNDGDVLINHGGKDAWIVKLTNDGTIQWKKTLGGANFDYLASVQLTSDSGFIFAGFSSSFNKGINSNSIKENVWIVKLNNSGTTQWQKNIGGSEIDLAYSIIQTADDGYIVVGGTESNDGFSSGNYGLIDAFVLKLNNNGRIQWKKFIGGSLGDCFYKLIQTSDGGYLVSGSSGSSDFNLISNQGGSDAWIVKLSHETININENDATTLYEVYPNPTNNNLFLKTNNSTFGDSYQLYNVSGQILINGIIDSEITEISLSQLTNGLYFIRVGNDNQNIKKVIVE